LRLSKLQTETLFSFEMGKLTENQLLANKNKVKVTVKIQIEAQTNKK